MAKIFISHATKSAHPDDDRDRVAARDIRDRAFEALEACGHAPLLDKRRLVPGDEWSAKLRQWLVECHGGVVIVDAQALASNWLRHESTILGLRRWLSADFRLITVLVGDVKREQLVNQGLGWLVDYQMIEARSDAAQTVADIVMALTGCGAARDASPQADWIHDVVRRLRCTADGIEGLAERLAMEGVDEAALGEPGELTLARALVNAAPETVRRALDELSRRGMSHAEFRELVWLLRPVCVDVAAGECLRALIDAPPREAAIVNVPYAPFGRLYVDRARLRPQHPAHGIEVDMIAGEGGERETESRLRETMLARTGQSGRRPNHFRATFYKTASDQDRALTQHFNRPEKFFLLIGASTANVATIGRLRSRMPVAAFILLPEIDDADDCAQVYGARVVEPRLTVETCDRLASHLSELDDLDVMQR